MSRIASLKQRVREYGVPYPAYLFACLDKMATKFKISTDECINLISESDDDNTRAIAEYYRSIIPLEDDEVEGVNLSNPDIIYAINNSLSFKVTPENMFYTMNFSRKMYSNHPFYLYLDPRFVLTEKEYLKLVKAVKTGNVMITPHPIFVRKVRKLRLINIDVLMFETLLKLDTSVSTDTALKFINGLYGPTYALKNLITERLISKYPRIARSKEFKLKRLKLIANSNLLITPNTKRDIHYRHDMAKYVKSGELDEAGQRVFGRWRDDITYSYVWGEKIKFISGVGDKFISLIQEKYSESACMHDKSMFLYLDKTSGVHISFKYTLKSIISECKKTKSRFYIVRINFILPSHVRIKLAHANVLVIDSKTKTGELMEPHGSIFASKVMKIQDDATAYSKYISKIGSFMKSNGYEFMPPSTICPVTRGLQIIDASHKTKFDVGFCEAWSLWYIELRLTYPDIPPDKLIDDTLKFFEKNPVLANTVIRNYAQGLMEELLEYEEAL